MDWQRARTGEKKNQRREAIYEAAVTLFMKDGYENVSFNGIASAAGFTKSNMYRYFSSREEIFLNIFSELFMNWAEDYLKRLKKLGPDVSTERFAKVWVKSFVSRPRFLDLTPFLFISLERNSSFDQLFEFKSLAKKLLYGLSVEVRRIFPEFTSEDAFRFLNLSFAATSNYWAASAQNDVLKKIYQQSEFKELKPDFERDLAAAVQICVRGIKASG